MHDAPSRLTIAQCRDAGLAMTLILLLVAYFVEREGAATAADLEAPY